MHKLSAAAIAVLMTAATGLVATAPALAQPYHGSMGHHAGDDDGCQGGNNGWSGDRGPRGGMNNGPGRGFGPRMGMGPGPAFGGMMGGPDGSSSPSQLSNNTTGLFHFQRGAEAIEVALVRLSHRLNLTDQQRPLFDEMRTSIMAAINQYAQATAQVRAERSTPDAPLTLPDLLQRRIVMENAHLEALTSVVPSVTAFYDSLTPEQQAMLTPGGRGGGRGGNNWGGDDNGSKGWPGQSGGPGGPGGPAGQPPSPPMGDQPSSGDQPSTSGDQPAPPPMGDAETPPLGQPPAIPAGPAPAPRG